MINSRTNLSTKLDTFEGFSKFLPACILTNHQNEDQSGFGGREKSSSEEESHKEDEHLRLPEAEFFFCQRREICEWKNLWNSMYETVDVFFGWDTLPTLGGS